MVDEEVSKRGGNSIQRSGLFIESRADEFCCAKVLNRRRLQNARGVLAYERNVNRRDPVRRCIRQSYVDVV